MSVQKEDYRTNRADYVIAEKHGADGDRDELLARKKKTLWLRDWRSAKLAANPCESLPTHGFIHRLDDPGVLIAPFVGRQKHACEQE